MHLNNIIVTYHLPAKHASGLKKPAWPTTPYGKGGFGQVFIWVSVRWNQCYFGQMFAGADLRWNWCFFGQMCVEIGMRWGEYSLGHVFVIQVARPAALNEKNP